MFGRYVALVILFILALVLQETWIPAIAISNVRPDLLLYFVVFIAFRMELLIDDGERFFSFGCQLAMEEPGGLILSKLRIDPAVVTIQPGIIG